jgi:hypothetical protein
MGLLPLAISVGALAGIWTYLSGTIGVLTWPAFIGWAFFFVAGGKSATVHKAALPLASGALLGWLAVAMSPYLGAATGVPIGVAIVAAIMVLMGNIPLFALIPAQFVGAAVFFGAGADLMATLISLAIGLVIGIISVAIPELLPKKEAEPAVAAA